MQTQHCHTTVIHIAPTEHYTVTVKWLRMVYSTFHCMNYTCTYVVFLIMQMLIARCAAVEISGCVSIIASCYHDHTATVVLTCWEPPSWLEAALWKSYRERTNSLKQADKQVTTETQHTWSNGLSFSVSKRPSWSISLRNRVGVGVWSARNTNEQSATYKPLTKPWNWASIHQTKMCVHIYISDVA